MRKIGFVHSVFPAETGVDLLLIPHRYPARLQESRKRLERSGSEKLSEFPLPDPAIGGAQQIDDSPPVPCKLSGKKLFARSIEIFTDKFRNTGSRVVKSTRAGLRSGGPRSLPTHPAVKGHPILADRGAFGAAHGGAMDIEYQLRSTKIQYQCPKPAPTHPETVYRL